MTRLIITREDTGETLAAHGWTKDIQEGRIFGSKSAATNAARSMCGCRGSRWRPTDLSGLPDFQHKEIFILTTADHAEMLDAIELQAL